MLKLFIWLAVGNVTVYIVILSYFECNSLTCNFTSRTVEVYRGPDFCLCAVVQTHHKLVNVVAWHPHITMATSSGSPYTHFLAVGSNEAHVAVVDLTSVFGS